MLNYEFPPIGGGAANAHLYLLKEYAQKDNLIVDVLTSGSKPRFITENFSKNITIYKVGIHKKNLHYWRKTEVLEWLFKARSTYGKLLQDNKYDLVHAFFGFPSGWLCYRTADKLPYIISLRGSDVPGYNVRLGLDYKILAGLFRRIWKNASAIVTNSKGLRELALKFMPQAKIDVIYNGVDTPKFNPSKNKKPHKPLRLLTVGRLIRRKRIDLLIEAISELNKDGFAAELNIAGQGNLMNELIALAERLKITDKINFLRRVPPDQMPEIYRNNDIFLMSSMHEGMSNAMLEAMASGLPIITTRCEGAEELITDNGVVVEQPQAQSIADAVQCLAKNKESYNLMSTAARKQAENFTWHNVAEQYMHCYKKIITTR
ncbi:MAG: glycosyltransferase family 4 protein [Planctomycetota bacterium]